MTSVAQISAVAPHLLSPVGNQAQVAESSSQFSNSSPRDIRAVFNYFKDPEDGSEPEPNYSNKPASYERVPISQELAVHDIRGREDQYTLDNIGFQVVRHTSTETEFLDDEHIKAVYYPEVEELLKQTTGATKIFIFDHTIRRQAVDSRVKVNDSKDPANSPPSQSLRGPVQRVHIDQSYSASKDRVLHHLPDEAETLLKGRYQIINVWRPIKTIFKDPLGIAAANSVQEDELVPIKLIYPHRVGETYSVRPAKEGRTDGGHKWHYISRQAPDEVTLIKCFDSKTDGRARRVPHSAFVDEEYKDEAARESIEVRTLVFHPNDTA